jgi:hypothetical protein
MARILNTCDLAMAQNYLRNTMRTAWEVGPENVALTLTEALADLYCVIIDGMETAPNIDDAAAAFEEVGYSRDLGAIAHRAVYAMGLGHAKYADLARMADDVRATPEWQRLAALYAEPVTPCCDWEVPASN